MNKIENKSEELFADICSKQYLKGFVFHSPKYNDPTEKEAGDIVLWIRDVMIVFEVVWRNTSSSTSTRAFIRRVSEKRKQLEKDFIAYRDKKIQLANQENNFVKYENENFNENNFLGVILVDSDVELESIHRESYKKSLEYDFSIATMTKNDFIDLLNEIDTIPDLSYYLKDRHIFLKAIYSSCPKIFINLNRRTERDLMALYKRKSNSFDGYNCSDLGEENIWDKYLVDFQDNIKNRNEENKETLVIDYIVDILLKQPLDGEEMPLYAWELGLLSRRERVQLAPKINNAIEETRTDTRQFAMLNHSTNCWIMFYFQYIEREENLDHNLENMTKHKLNKEIRECSFQYSVFGYGFHIVSSTEKPIARISLVILDAENIIGVSNDEYNEALNYFGKPKEVPIKEFPEDI